MNVDGDEKVIPELLVCKTSGYWDRGLVHVTSTECTCGLGGAGPGMCCAVGESLSYSHNSGELIPI